MRPALDSAGHRVPRTKPTCLLHTWRPHRRRPFALVLHLHQHKSSRNLHLQYLAKNQSTQCCQSFIIPGSDHPPVLEPHMVLTPELHCRVPLPRRTLVPTPPCLAPKLRFAFLLVAGKPLVFPCSPCRWWWGALDSFTSGETLFARRPLGAYPRAPGGRTQSKTPLGLCDPSWDTCHPSRS
jgi:hypothetical protein